MSAGKSEVVAWMLRRKSDGFVRAIYANEPSPETFAIAEMEGDEYVRMAPESLLLDARAERDLAIEAVCQADAFSCELAEKLRRAEALAGERLAALVRIKERLEPDVIAWQDYGVGYEIELADVQEVLAIAIDAVGRGVK